MLTLGFVGQKVVDFGGGSVVGTDLETLVGHVEDHWAAQRSQIALGTGILDGCRSAVCQEELY